MKKQSRNYFEVDEYEKIIFLTLSNIIVKVLWNLEWWIFIFAEEETSLIKQNDLYHKNLELEWMGKKEFIAVRNSGVNWIKDIKVKTHGIQIPIPSTSPEFSW